MATAVIENKPKILKSEILNRVAELENHLTVVQEELKTIIRGSEELQVILPELHDKASGRINAQKLAVYMGVPLKRLADGLNLNYKALHRNPSSEAGQIPLQPVKRCLEILHEFFNKPETVRVWLNTPHPDLDGNTALEVILADNPNAVLRILDNAASGVPV